MSTNFLSEKKFIISATNRSPTFLCQKFKTSLIQGNLDSQKYQVGRNEYFAIKTKLKFSLFGMGIK